MTRPVQTPLSFLDAPFDDMLGQVSHVRILRALTASKHPVPPAELARITRLDPTGLGRAVDRLARLGVVRILGVARGRVVELNRTHVFARVLHALFEAERERRGDLYEALQGAIGTVAPPPRAAWVEGPHASRQDTVDDAVEIGVLVSVRDRQQVVAQLTPRLRELEDRFDLTMELRVRTRADLETLLPTQRAAIQAGRLLFGVPPFPQSPTTLRPSDNDPAAPSAMTHPQLDEQALRKAEHVAKAITRDPRLIEQAQRWLAQRMSQASEGERHALREWEHILSMPPRRIAAFLRDKGERATRLRQSSPFVGILDRSRT